MNFVLVYSTSVETEIFLIPYRLSVDRKKAIEESLVQQQQQCDVHTDVRVLITNTTYERSRGTSPQPDCYRQRRWTRART